MPTGPNREVRGCQEFREELEALPLKNTESVLDGFSHREIGEQLSISEGTSRWHLSEAKKQLRRLLENNPAVLPAERGERK